MNTLENNELIIETKKFGAELTRIYSKKLNKEILWNGDSKFWGRHSPILFPIVGRLKDNETYIDGNLYNMSQHGFARDLEFDVVDLTDNSISYKLTSNDSTKELYPYSFELIIKYTLVNANVNIEWTVNNIDSKEIYFSIGAHPAFNTFCNDFSDFYLEFKARNKIEQILLDGPYVAQSLHIDNLNTLELKPSTFKNDALIYTNIDYICLKSKASDNFIKVSFADFPLVGVWSPYYSETNTSAPFICIEPWYGLADDINSDKLFKNKNYINKLAMEESFKTSYTIELN